MAFGQRAQVSCFLGQLEASVEGLLGEVWLSAEAVKSAQGEFADPDDRLIADLPADGDSLLRPHRGLVQQPQFSVHVTERRAAAGLAGQVTDGEEHRMAPQQMCPRRLEVTVLDIGDRQVVFQPRGKSLVAELCRQISARSNEATHLGPPVLRFVIPEQGKGQLRYEVPQRRRAPGLVEDLDEI
jgi:hypothetical protein